MEVCNSSFGMRSPPECLLLVTHSSLQVRNNCGDCGNSHVGATAGFVNWSSGLQNDHLANPAARRRTGLRFQRRTMRRCVAAVVALLLALPVRAQEIAPVAPATPQQPLEQVLYKGVVGNLLDQVPMDAQERLDLQRANAVVGNAAAARSAALLLGITASPLFLIGGLVWGIYAASRIKPASEQRPASEREPAGSAASEPIEFQYVEHAGG